MTEFKGLIGLEQLSPEVKAYIDQAIAKAVAEATGNTPPPVDVINNGNLLAGRVIMSKTMPETTPDVWFEIESPEFENLDLQSSNVIVAETDSIPVSRLNGQIVVEIEK